MGLLHSVGSPLSSGTEVTHLAARAFKIRQSFFFFFFNLVVNTEAPRVIMLSESRFYHRDSNSLWPFETRQNIGNINSLKANLNPKV